MIGIDVGGANVKVVYGDRADTIYCPLWQEAPLHDILSRYDTGEGVGVAVVMSGELADCFLNKMEGIRWIVDTVKEVFPGAVFYGTDGKFHDSPVPALAAANWLASAAYLNTLYPDGILVDMGSTTTDIIPLTNPPSLHGLTDLARLQKGYLLYTGLLRTTLPAILRSVCLDNIPTPVSAEYFAASADAHLVLGHINLTDYTCDTPDGKGKDRESCLRRLARVVCSDLEEIGEVGAMQVAGEFWRVQGAMIREAVSDAQKRSGARTILTAGIGAGLLAPYLGALDLSRELGPVADALPAFAVMEVFKRSRG